MAHNDSVTDRIGAFMARSFDGRRFAPDDDIFELGFGNSLFAMQLVAYVEREFAIEIDSDDLDMKNFRSIGAIAGLVTRKAPLGGQAAPQPAAGGVRP